MLTLDCFFSKKKKKLLQKVKNESYKSPFKTIAIVKMSLINNLLVQKVKNKSNFF